MATSIQQRLYPFSTCYGYGPANSKGLQLQSFEEGDEVVCTFHPEEHHSNGMGTLSGGVIATLLDTPSELRARIIDAEADVMAVQANLRIEGKVRVQAESRWVRIDRK